MSDVFISYSRQDSPFVMQLKAALRKAGRVPWIDVDGIRPAEDFMQAIFDAIDHAQAFIFVLSPDSASSEICARELEHAVQANKRLVPVVCREVQVETVPEALRGLNWIPRAGDTAARHSFLDGLFGREPLDGLVGQLLEAVDTDLDWVRLHTRVLWRAREWDSSGREKGHLLQGADLTAVHEFARDEARQPRLNQLQAAYIQASRQALQSNREGLAHLSAEIESVARMHAAGLPAAAEAFSGERRFEIFAILEQAKGVGGDLYDFYRLDGDRVLMMVADVAGKGLAGGYFMQVAKALVKSAAMRGRFRLDELVREVDRDLRRENPMALFVAAFIAVLDAETGKLTYCLAGCERPILVPRGAGRPIAAMEEAEGPPLCTVEDFPYASATVQLRPGDRLCVFTDGVSEAAGLDGRLYGRDALEHFLRMQPPDRPARDTCDALRTELKAHLSGTPPADDFTLLVLRWNMAGDTATG